LRKGRGKPNAGIGVHQPGGGDGSGSGSGNSMEFSLEAEEEGDASDGHDMVGGVEGEEESGSEEESERSVELSVDTSGGKGPWFKVNVLTDDVYEEHLRAVAAYATAAAAAPRPSGRRPRPPTGLKRQKEIEGADLLVTPTLINSEP